MMRYSAKKGVPKRFSYVWKPFWNASFYAERGGFEPPIRFWRIHAFQACLLSHSSISPQLCALNCGAKVCFLCDIAKDTAFF